MDKRQAHKDGGIQRARSRDRCTQAEEDTGLAQACPGSSRGSPSHLVTKDLDLADSSVHQALAGVLAVGVDLQVQGDSLTPFCEEKSVLRHGR